MDNFSSANELILAPLFMVISVTARIPNHPPSRPQTLLYQRFKPTLAANL